VGNKNICTVDVSYCFAAGVDKIVSMGILWSFKLSLNGFKHKTNDNDTRGIKISVDGK
jgi:hypothetical protein